MADEQKNDGGKPQEGALHAISLVLGIAGLLTVGGSFLMPTMVDTHFDHDAFERIDAVFNLGLLQSQMMVFQAGLACIIASVVIWGVDRLSR